MKETEQVIGSTGQIYYPTARPLTKRLGSFPTMEITLPKDDMPRIEEEAYFSFYVGGVLKFKGIVLDPITYDENIQNVTVTLRDYIWILYRDYDLFNTTGSMYRVECLYELVDTTLDNILAGTPFTAGTTPPQYLNNRYEFNDRTTALLNLAALVKYGTYTDGTYWTDLTKIELESGSCDVWLDHATNTVNIGLLGAKNVSNQWIFETFDITDYITPGTLAQLQTRLSLPNTVIVLGAGDGLNQIIGRAIWGSIGCYFWDDIATDMSTEYSAWGNTAEAVWTHDTTNKQITVTGVQSGGDLTAYYSTNFDVVYVSPNISIKINVYADYDGGVFFAKTDDSNFWVVFIHKYLISGGYERTSVGITQVISSVWTSKTYISGMTLPNLLNLEVLCDTTHGRITVNVDGEEIIRLEGQSFVSGVAGLYACAHFHGNWNTQYQVISFDEYTNVPPVTVITNNEYVNALAATHAAQAELHALRIPTNFTLEIEPSLFESGVVDIGHMVTITAPEEAAGTFRVRELILTEETCTLSIGRAQETFSSQSAGTSTQVNIAGSYTTGASVAQALPALDSPLYANGNNVTYAILSFRIPKNMMIINFCDLYWYTDYMTVDQEFTANTSATSPNTLINAEISVDGAAFAAITGSPFSGDQARVSILDVLGYSPQDKIVRIKFTLHMDGECRIYGGGDLQGLVVV